MRVLLVEDDRRIASDIVPALEAAGYVVETVSVERGYGLYRLCAREELAGYKQPKDVVFVTLAELPRSTTGKIQRHEVEAWLRARSTTRAAP